MRRVPSGSGATVHSSVNFCSHPAMSVVTDGGILSAAAPSVAIPQAGTTAKSPTTRAATAIVRVLGMASEPPLRKRNTDRNAPVPLAARDETWWSGPAAVTREERMHATADQLRRVTSAILKSGGSAAPEADLVADHLVQANLAGHDSHGVGMIPAYVRHLKAGLVVPNTRAKLVKDDGAVRMFDGGRGYGRRVAGEALAAGITRCRQTGVVALTLANAHHIGRVGAYGELASAAGLVSLHFVNVADHRGLVAPFRGSDARFSTNPVCIAVP